jgi:23S rRNA (cytidine1920-2'-O)/16S rRNA (cytidine1409-2'-O)-methyltransferase
MPSSKKKVRLDLLLIQRELFESCTKAQAAIMSGVIFVNRQKSTKSGALLDPSCLIEIKGKASPYVSRGGLKLEHALKAFNIYVRDRVCLDIGASTGGFTDCLLQNGAKLVYAVDVGYGQIAWKLRQDKRVMVIEKTNARYLSRDVLGSKFQVLRS